MQLLHALVIDGPTLPPKQAVQSTHTPARTRLRELAETLPKRYIGRRYPCRALRAWLAWRESITHGERGGWAGFSALPPEASIRELRPYAYQNMTRLAVLAFALLAGSCSSTGGVESVALSGLAAKEIIKDIDESLKTSIGQAITGGDYLVEKAGRQGDMLLQSADYVLGKNIDKAFDKLNYTQQKFLVALHDFSQDLDSFQGGLLRLEDFLVLDAYSLIGEIPFKKTTYVLREIEGYALIPRDEGTYSLNLVSNAVGPEFSAEFTIGGRVYGANRQLSVGAHERSLEIPVADLAEHVSNSEVVRIPFSVACRKSGKEKVVYSYDGVLLMLPRSPYQYTLTEHWKGSGWSDKLTWSAWGEAHFAGLGKGVEGEDPHNGGDVTATVPAGGKIERGTEQTGGGSPYGRWEPGYTYSNGERSVSRHYKNWYEHNNVARLRVQYRTSTVTTEVTEAEFVDSVEGRLSFGVHTAVLHDTYTTYTLKLMAFNGEEHTITPSTDKPGPIRVATEEAGAGKRLVLQISNPFSGR